MEYLHRDGADSAARISLGAVRDWVPVDEDGVFVVDDDRDDFDTLHERVVAAGHEPVEDDGALDGADPETDGDADEAELPTASNFTETELVEMSRDELRPIASQYDDINGNASGDKLTEELIKQRREEVEDGS